MDQLISSTTDGTTSDRHFHTRSTYVVLRFGLRLAILIALAFVPQIGFAEAFPRLLDWQRVLRVMGDH